MCKNVCMFKMLKKLLEMSYQTGPKFTLASLSGIPSVSYFQDSQLSSPYGELVMTVYHVKDPTKRKRYIFQVVQFLLPKVKGFNSSQKIYIKCVLIFYFFCLQLGMSFSIGCQLS